MIYIEQIIYIYIYILFLLSNPRSDAKRGRKSAAAQRIVAMPAGRVWFRISRTLSVSLSTALRYRGSSSILLRDLKTTLLDPIVTIAAIVAGCTIVMQLRPAYVQDYDDA